MVVCLEKATHNDFNLWVQNVCVLLFFAILRVVLIYDPINSICLVNNFSIPLIMLVMKVVVNIHASNIPL